MLKSCKWCGRMHPIAYDCPKKPQARRKSTQAQRFRNTAAWRHCRSNVNQRDLHLCRLCLLRGVLESEGLSTHHIIPLEESMDYALAEDWCITLCDEDHKAADRGEYDRQMLHTLALTSPSLSTECTQRAEGGRKGWTEGTPQG